MAPGAELPLLPLRNQAVFPRTRASVIVMRPPSRELLKSLEPGAELLLFAQRDERTEAYPTAADLPEIGVLTRVVSKCEHVPGNDGVEVEVLSRVRLDAVTQTTPWLRGRSTVIEPAPVTDEASFELHEALKPRALAVLPTLSAEVKAGLAAGRDPGQTADWIASGLPGRVAPRAELFATLDGATRLRKVEPLLAAEEARQKGILATLERLKRTPRDLWPMEAGAEEHATQMVAAGTMTTEEAALIRQFAANGFVIWPGLIPARDIDALVADLGRIHEHPGRFLSTDHKRSAGFRFTGPERDRFESLFDTYVNFESARRVCLHPTIVRFLNLLFGTRPIATQQLLFQRSNGHEAHQDTAFVCAEEPLHMVATWIALEDVVQGRGELTYFEGSHRIPGHPFADGSKRFTGGVDDPAAMRDDLLAQCKAHGCAKRDFLAKKGDVFVWAADLVHASNPRTRPIEETRLSCVTHYCPETTRPLWHTLNPDHQTLQPYGEHALIGSSHYRLPFGPDLIRPDFMSPLPT